MKTIIFALASVHKHKNTHSVAAVEVDLPLTNVIDSLQHKINSLTQPISKSILRYCNRITEKKNCQQNNLRETKRISTGTNRTNHTFSDYREHIENAY